MFRSCGSFVTDLRVTYGYTYVYTPVPMSRRLQIILSDTQYAYLSRASSQTSLSMSELIRRALDERYPASRGQASESEFTIAVWRRPADAPANSGRRAGLRFD
jgi:hypothetical protein